MSKEANKPEYSPIEHVFPISPGSYSKTLYDSILFDLDSQLNDIKSRIDKLGFLSSSNHNLKDNIQSELYELLFKKDEILKQKYHRFNQIYTYYNQKMGFIFHYILNEISAYSLIQSNYLPFIPAILGYRNKKIIEDMLLSGGSEVSVFVEEIVKFKDMVDLAVNKGYSKEEISYAVLGTRSLTQAVKFIYLYMHTNPR